MPAAISADKSREELRHWHQTDPDGLVDYALDLQTELRRLRDAAAQNSRNSSRPPSTDRSEKPRPKSLRKKSGRKTGGQPGHPGRTLQPSDTPTHVELHRCLECSCGENLSQEPAVDFQRRQVFDLPSLQLECTEHRAQIKECPCCHQISTAPFPASVKAPVQYGKNFRALLAYLYDAQEGASRRIREMCAEMFGYPVSEATLQAARQEQHAALEPYENRLVEILPKEPVLHADETSVPINQVNHWLHVLALEGRLASTSIVFGDATTIKENGDVLKLVCAECDSEVAAVLTSLGYLWKNATAGIVKSAIRNFANHPECMLTYSDPLLQYIEWLESQNITNFDVLLRSAKDETTNYPVGKYEIAPVSRTVEVLTDEKIIFNKRRVGSKGDERAGLTPEEIEMVQKNFSGKNLPDRLYRSVPNRNPLFLIYFVRVRKTVDDPDERIVPAYAVSFPGDPGSANRPAKLVQYVVNTKWWEQNYALNDEEPDEEES